MELLRPCVYKVKPL